MRYGDLRPVREDLRLVSPDGKRNILLGSFSHSDSKVDYDGGYWHLPTWAPDSKAIVFLRNKTIRMLKLPSELLEDRVEPETAK